MGGTDAVHKNMSVVHELDRLAGLRERGHLSHAEHDEVKQQVLRASRRPMGSVHDRAPTPDGAYLLYRLVATWLKRVAAAMAVVALLFGLVRAALPRRARSSPGDQGHGDSQGIRDQDPRSPASDRSRGLGSQSHRIRGPRCRDGGDRPRRPGGRAVHPSAPPAGRNPQQARRRSTFWVRGDLSRPTVHSPIVLHAG